MAIIEFKNLNPQLVGLFITVGSMAFGVIIGAIITWLVTRSYYIKASNELKNESAELRRLSKLLLRGFENAGLIELNRNNTGEITGIVWRGRANLHGEGRLSAKGTVISPKNHDNQS